MKKQKICIIGGSLTGLVTAISLSKLNCKIDLITGNLVKNFESSRTIAVSENNFHFLNKLNISKSLKKEIWTCSKMKLYTEVKSEKFSEIFELNKEGNIIADLNYEEDSNCDTDLNVVMTQKGEFIELQGTAEDKPFTRAQADDMLALAEKGISELVDLQKTALGW